MFILIILSFLSLMPLTNVGIIVDFKLRWFLQIMSLISFRSWSINCLWKITGTWRGSHPSSLLPIYKYIIRSKFDYGCFLFSFGSFSNRKKLNKLQTNCPRNTMGYLISIPLPAIEVETTCPPFNIKCSVDSLVNFFLSLLF